MVEDFSGNVMTKIVKRSIKLDDGKTLSASCAAEFGQQATSVLKTFQQLQVKEGQQVEFGSTVLSIAKEEQELAIVEPDLFIDDPLSHWIDDITITLRLARDQIAFLSMLKLEPCSCSLFQKMVVSKNVLGHPNIYMHRQKPSDANDSGWLIGYSDNSQDVRNVDDAGNYDSMYIFELFPIRPRLLEMICLPLGHVVVIKDNLLQAVLDESDRAIFETTRE
jgi:hypothetical protein